MKNKPPHSGFAEPIAIPANCNEKEALPPALRDLAELLAEIAMRRLQGPAPQDTGAQEPIGDH